MKLLAKLNSYLIILASCLLPLSSASLCAQTAETLSNWLPLLSSNITSNIKRIQPNHACAQNQLLNIQASHKNSRLSVDIAAIDWDFNCPPVNREGNAKRLSLPLQKEQSAVQLKELFDLLAVLPEIEIRVKSLNLTINDKRLSLSLFIKKNSEQLVLTLSGAQLQSELKINLQTKELNLQGSIETGNIAQSLTLPATLKKLLNNPVGVTYSANLNNWQQGRFTLYSQGGLPGLAELGNLNLAGEVDLLTGQLALSQLALDLQKVSYNLSATQEWQIPSISLKLTDSASFNLLSLQINRLPLELRVARSVLFSRGPSATMQRIRSARQKLPALFTAVNAQGGPDDLLLDWRASLLKQSLTGKLQYAHKKVQVRLPATHLSPQTLVESLHSYLPATELLQIKSGELTLQLSATYDVAKHSASVAGRIGAQQIAGENNNLLFDGISVDSELDYRFEKGNLIVNRDRQQLTIANLFVGVPIQALQLDGKLNGGEPVIDHFKARLLGGRVDFDDFRLAPSGQTLINLSGLSLTEMVKYSAYPEIQSAAIIDGVLPLALTTQGLTVSHGMIFARAPGGYIKVPENTVTAAISKGNPGASYAMQLLSNFQFETLQGTIGYTADGESELKIAIKGINPNVSGTQPINFNYSHNENILKLLESLRFNEQLERQIRERY